MLDVIADFWKSGKKAQAQEPLRPELLQVGSSLGFGFVPQAMLSGHRLHVSAINTYQFGDESLTSFALTPDKDHNPNSTVSMIVAESEGEHYLAISRRISISDRSKLFDAEELEKVMTRADVTRLACRDNILDFKGWVVPVYRREIQNLKGRIYKGDHRTIPLSAAGVAQEFEYSLLVSDSNEHAIEIEKYADDRIEIYATVYRRMSDIGEITHPSGNDAGRPDIKFPSSPPSAAAKTAPVMSSPPKLPEVKPAMTPAAAELPKAAPIKLQEFGAPAAKTEISPLPKMAPAPLNVNQSTKEKSVMENTNVNGAGAAKSALLVQPNVPDTYAKQEIKAVNNNSMKNFENDAIECDLRVANKIIDEAIRNEMRLTDIVRRIIELPVAYPESVQIPMTLTDEDYALLAIRYGIPSSDRNAIKKRIIEDLNDFSGGKKAAKPA